MWAQKEAAVGQASAGGLAMFVIPGSTVKYNGLLFNANNIPNVYDLPLKGFVNPPTSTNNKRANKYLLSYYLEQSFVLSCIWYWQSTQITGLC